MDGPSRLFLWAGMGSFEFRHIAQVIDICKGAGSGMWG
jgi:hypothetical protein